MIMIGESFEQCFDGGFEGTTKTCVIRILDKIKVYQERIRIHVEGKFVNFMPTNSTSHIYIAEGKTLLRETEHLLKNVECDTKLSFAEASSELAHYVLELREVSLGMRVSYRILKIDDLFQRVVKANSTKDYLVVLDLLSKLKYLIYCGSNSGDDRLFAKCNCYDTIKVKYHIQNNILQQNLQQRFDSLVQFSEKSFPSAKHVTFYVSKDEIQLQNTVVALFQARYNPIKICDFLLEKCLIPMITKPVSVEYSTDDAEYFRLNISYSHREFGNCLLRPTYNQVFMHIKLLLDCLKNINVNVWAEQYVLTIIGNHIKKRMLEVLVNECLMYAIPETMVDYQDSTLVDDVLCFEEALADVFLIDAERDRILSDFAINFDKYFKQRFSKKILESAREIMQKDLQDMITISDSNTADEVAKNPFLFPQCVISKSTLELINLMERIFHQPMDTSASTETEEANSFLDLISFILDTYINEIPKIHEKLLESIPQQAALFYNNCMFLAHWIAKNAEADIPTHSTLVKMLQSTGETIFRTQVFRQQKILSQILEEFDVTDTYSIGLEPLKLLRQCLRQMELLKNVWFNVLPDITYNATLCNLLNELCYDLIKRILSLEDISATVATELSEVIEMLLDKVPNLFKEKDDVFHVSCWMKLQQMKMILNASLQEIMEQWCDGAGILMAYYKPEEIRRLIRALFQNTDRRSKALSGIV